MSTEKFIFRLDELGKEHNDLVGKKSANLGELTNAGFRVPPGFALSLAAYEEFIKTAGVMDEIREYFAEFKADPNDPKDLRKYVDSSKEVRRLVESKAMPKNIEDSVALYYDELCEKTGMSNVAVSTRSAGSTSHPGQYETYLGVAGALHVMTNIIRVWSSTFNTRSIIARARMGLPLEYDPIGVCVLKMVDAKAAGVMFTAEPNTADASKVVIEGTWGLGESVVSGAVAPDTWVVDKASYKITDCRLSPTTAGNGMTSETGSPSSTEHAHGGRKGCLTDEEVVGLVKIGEKIERHFGSPQDIEWAIDGERDQDQDNIVLLQTRPEKFRLEINFAF
ncbi:MAG: PEP/pyruvate-binding domain-containing protein [Pseudomonadota bacterium]